MDVVSPELNSLLPDEIMDTEAIVMEEDPTSQPVNTTVQSESSEDTPVPMETDAPIVSENVSLCSDVPPTQRTQALTTSTTTDSTLCSIRSGSQLLLTTSSASLSPLTIRPALATSTAATKTTFSLSGTSVPTSGLQKLSAPFTISANHQIILNKVASSQATDAAKSPGISGQVIKPEGQKLLVTAIGKSGQPIVLQLPHTGSKPGLGQASGDAKHQLQQFKVVTIGGRSELKPVMGMQSMSTASQVPTLHAQQLNTVQVRAISLTSFRLK